MPIRLGVDARRQVFELAAEEARRRGDRRLGTDHLLLALVHDDNSLGVRATGVDLARLRAAGDALDRQSLGAVGIDVAALPPPVPLKARRFPALTSGARAVIKEAVDDARASKSRQILSRHLLRALLARRQPDPAAELLAAAGVDPEQARRRLAELAD